MFIYVGTYTSAPSKSKGIYTLEFDGSSGSLSPRKTTENVEDPSFMAIPPGGAYLYAVNELLEYRGEKSGAVSAFQIDSKTGDLKFINKVTSRGAAPCYVTVSSDGKFVLVANYLGGNVAVFPVKADGGLGEAVSVQQHSGSGPHKDRQEAAHAHSVVLDRDNKYAFVCDLGIDRVMIYEFDRQTGELRPNPSQAFHATEPGAGPRHFKFHPNGRFAFLVNELNMTVSSLAYDAAAGSLKLVDTISTLPRDFKGENTCADLHVSPDGRFVYASNRGHDSIAVFSFDEASGRLGLVEFASTGGRSPRNFGIDPSGRFLLAANQRSNSIVTFSIDPASGRLKPSGKPTNTPTPACVLFHPLK